MAPSTKAKYKSGFNTWKNHCSRNKLNPKQTTIANIVNFMADQSVNEQKSYSTIRGYICSMTSNNVQVIGCANWTNHPIIRKTMKGIFRKSPPTPLHVATWDIRSLLDHLERMDTSNEIQCASKLATLFMILSASRVNSLQKMKITNMYLCDSEVTFVMDEPLKHSRPGYPQRPSIFLSYPKNPSLCPVKTLKHYLTFRLAIPDTEYLFVTSTLPRRKAHPDTIRRWITDTMLAAGIDTDNIKAHSCRAASSSAAKSVGVPIKTIMSSANWSNESTFKKFYKKYINAKDLSSRNYGSLLLDKI